MNHIMNRICSLYIDGEWPWKWNLPSRFVGSGVSLVRLPCCASHSRCSLLWVSGILCDSRRLETSRCLGRWTEWVWGVEMAGKAGKVGIVQGWQKLIRSTGCLFTFTSYIFGVCNLLDQVGSCLRGARSLVFRTYSACFWGLQATTRGGAEARPRTALGGKTTTWLQSRREIWKRWVVPWYYTVVHSLAATWTPRKYALCFGIFILFKPILQQNIWATVKRSLPEF